MTIIINHHTAMGLIRSPVQNSGYRAELGLMKLPLPRNSIGHFKMALAGGSVALSLALNPMPAHAGKVERDGDVVIFEAFAGETNVVTVGFDGLNFIVQDNVEIDENQAVGCILSSDNKIADCGQGVTHAEVSLGNGNDSVKPLSSTPFFLKASGGPGNDILIGSGFADVLDGDDGNDTLNGGFGSDLLRGGAGDDQLKGGNGKDTEEGGFGHDIFDEDSDVRAGADTYFGQAGPDEIFSADGVRDQVHCGIGFDHVDTGINIAGDVEDNVDVTGANKCEDIF